MRRISVPALLVLALLLVACPADDAAVEAAECDVGQTDGDLSLYNWSDYIDPELVAAFEQEFDVSVVSDEFSSNEEMLAKVQTGGSGYDVIVPSDYMVEIMIERELLLPLQEGAIPNQANVADRFADPAFDPGSRYSAPYQWGTTGIGVNVDEVGELPADIPRSWSLVFDPELTQAYEGRISLLDDARETMGAALKYLGYSLNTTDESELREAADLLRDARDHVAQFTSVGFEDLLATGETVVTHGWSGDILVAQEETDATIEYVIPEEGSVIWVDNMAIVFDAPSPCTAHTFINYMLEAENAAALTNWTHFASPNAAAEELIDADVLENPSVYPPAEVLENLEFIVDVGEATPLYEQLFAEVRA